MISDTAMRALSDNELDAVSGGQLVICERTQTFSFLGYMDINVAKCENGQTIVYGTFD